MWGEVGDVAVYTGDGKTDRFATAEQWECDYKKLANHGVSSEPRFVIVDEPTRNVDACKQLCCDEKSCGSFEHTNDADGERCKLYTHDAPEAVERTGADWYGKTSSVSDFVTFTIKHDDCYAPRWCRYSDEADCDVPRSDCEKTHNLIGGR